jgi:hypothetical protein
MRYTIAAGSRGQLPITDESGLVQYTLVRSRSLCDASGAELAVIKPRPFRSRTDILMGGQSVASVRSRGFGGSYQIEYGGTAYTAKGGSFSRAYAVTRADGTTVATFSQRRGFRSSFDAEIRDGEDQALLLAAMFAIYAIRQRRTAAMASGAAAPPGSA